MNLTAPFKTINSLFLACFSKYKENYSVPITSNTAMTQLMISVVTPEFETIHFKKPIFLHVVNIS